MMTRKMTVPSGTDVEEVTEKTSVYNRLDVANKEEYFQSHQFPTEAQHIVVAFLKPGLSHLRRQKIGLQWKNAL
jgi:hypothetical protein